MITLFIDNKQISNFKNKNNQSLKITLENKMEENLEESLHRINSFSFTKNYESPKYLTESELSP